MFDHCLLESGLTVIGEPNLQARSTAIGYFVRAGARDEAPEQSGVSHFLEHMAFKGPVGLDALELNRRFDAIGASVNAFTGEESTAYHAATLPEHAPELLGLLTGLLHPELRAADFELEKGVILEEIEMYQDDPASRLFEGLREQYYAGHPLGRSVLGVRSSVSGLTREGMQAYHAERYSPLNTVLAFSGRYDWQALLEQVSTLTAGWTSQGTSRTRPAFAPRSSVELLPDARLSRTLIGMMFPGFSAHDPRRMAAAVLTEILGGENGRLFWILIDTGLADEASLSHQDGDGLGHFEGVISTDPERAAEVLALFTQELERVQRDGVSTGEVRRAVNKMAVATALRDDTPYPRLFSLGLEYLYTGSLLSTEALIGQLRSVTLEGVNALLGARPFEVRALRALGQVSALEGQLG